MRRYLILCFLFTAVSGKIFGQRVSIQTADVQNFWIAFDSIKAEADVNKHEAIIQRLYFDKATVGLAEFTKRRDWKPAKFVESINRYDNFWRTVRPKTLNVTNEIPQIKRLFKRYKKLYKAFVPPEIYFVIGYCETGGTTTQTQILIGTEIASADSTVNGEGLHPLVQNFMLTNKGAFSIVAHELTHTQHKGGDMETKRKSNLLGLCLAEGSCDFMAELLVKESIDRPYMVYGRKHEKELWEKFKLDMHGKNTINWLYNGAYKKKGDADLGYFIGYSICKSYYQRAMDKKEAIRKIVSLDFEDTDKLNAFLEMSSYNP
ncbi:hypothetical protein [Runella sp.]|uniref:gliding motility protein GldB-related protein n=1 Tax=Runella sp. TaxID=1960881 RepID=UPI003D14BC11